MTEPSNPLDEGLTGMNEEPLEDMVSKTESLGHYMASLGFQPKPPRGKDTLEYHKIYSDPLGRVGRVVAVIQKDEMGLEPKAPQYFTVTVQFHIAANEKEARVKAPPFCRQDILRLLSHFLESEDRHEEVSECALCGASTAEFIERDGVQVCLDCSKRKGQT